MSSMNNLTHILLIEDNPGDVNLVKIYLKDSSIKHELHHADSFFDGVDTAKNQEIDLVLLDLSLPDSTGFKTLSNFLEKCPGLPVIVLTGINNEIVGNQAVKAGAQDFLVKGQFDGKLLGRAIRYAMQRYKTQLKLEKTANELALSERRYVEAQEMAHFGSWEMDIVSNSMRWTDEMYRIFGFYPTSFAPTLSDYMNYVHLEDRKMVESFFEEAAKDGQLHQLEHRIVVDGRNIKYISIQAKVYFEEATNKILLVGAVQDITERKLSEQLIIEKNISNKASKVKEEALAEMSFHIRTPLSSIVNLLYLIDNTSTSNQQREYLDGLKTSVDDLSMMINNLLNFSVLITEQLKVEDEEIKVNDFMVGIQKVLQIKSENAHLELQFDLAERMPEKVISDSNKLTQIIYNLIDTVIRQSPEHSKVNIQMRNQGFQDETDQLFLNVHNPQLQLSSEKIQEMLEADKLLEVYSEDPSEEVKSQLGMAIVAKLIKTMQGTLMIECDEHTGTNLRVNIPVRVPKQLRFSASDKPDAPLRILLVEDHFLNQIATKKVLTTWSSFVSVDIAENGLVGVEKYREHGYDIILMDLQMPVMTGIEASRKIREQSSVPIIALTANSSKQEAERCFEAGINDYIAKPFKPQDLYRKIMEQLITVATQ